MYASWQPSIFGSLQFLPILQLVIDSLNHRDYHAVHKINRIPALTTAACDLCISHASAIEGEGRIPLQSSAPMISVPKYSSLWKYVRLGTMLSAHDYYGRRRNTP